MRRYTMGEIADANTAGGQFFFSKETMRCFGDTLGHFRVRYRGEEIYIQRVRQSRNAPAGYPLDERLRRFDPETGRIGSPEGELQL